MLAEPEFGNRGFRYFGKPSSRYPNYPMYSLYFPEQTRRLLTQLKAVEPHFKAMADGEGSPREQLFEGLLPPVQEAVAECRILWVRTDT